MGSGLVHPQPVLLSQLIDLVNERFGTDFNQADQLFFDQIVEAAMADDGLRQAAAVNPGDKFELVFKHLIENLFVERMDQNEEIFVRFMNDLPFQKVVTAWMASEAYKRLRGGAAGESTTAAPKGDATGTRLKLRIVQPRPEDRYVTCVPLVPLKAAAGAFSDPQHVEDDNWEWVAVDAKRRLRPGMFVAQVVGKSMEPAIPDGSYCLFRAPVIGTRQGKIVLVQLRNAIDPDNGERYTVKRYQSEKVTDGDSWRHARITLKPINPDFQPIELTGAEEGELQVVAELVEVLGGAMTTLDPAWQPCRASSGKISASILSGATICPNHPNAHGLCHARPHICRAYGGTRTSCGAGALPPWPIARRRLACARLAAVSVAAGSGVSATTGRPVVGSTSNGLNSSSSLPISRTAGMTSSPMSRRLRIWSSCVMAPSPSQKKMLPGRKYSRT